jgi:hypothetical protein
MLNIEPPPGGTTKPFVSIVMTSECSFDIPWIPDDLVARIARSGGLSNGKSRTAPAEGCLTTRDSSSRGADQPDYVAPQHTSSDSPLQGHGRTIAGTPAQVRDHIATQSEAAGAAYFVCDFAFGSIVHHEAMQSVELLRTRGDAAFCRHLNLHPSRGTSEGMNDLFRAPRRQATKSYLALARRGRPGVVVIQKWWGLNDQIGTSRVSALTSCCPTSAGPLTILADEANHMMSVLGFAGATHQDLGGAAHS